MTSVENRELKPTGDEASMSSSPTQISRREFVRRAGIGIAAAAASTVLVERKPAHASSAEADENAVGVLIDLTRCTGCNSCALACKVANNKPNPELPPQELSSDAFTFVAAETASSGQEVHVKRQCMHCLHPACVSACTVGALRKTAEGPVVYDAHKCIGCRYCQYACPFGVPTYDWDNPLGLIHKCELCFQRMAEGEQPACVAACPNGALHFGKRSELLAQAHALITAHPDQYEGHVYGEHEAGGTSMLYLSPVPFEQINFPALADGSISHTAETVMAMTPAVALTVASLATGFHLLLRRRQHKDDAAHFDWPAEKED
jgi:Fe-S-cluster-containing dehydrogenase component